MTLANFHPGESVHAYLSDCATSSGAIFDPTPLKFTFWPASGSAPTVATTSGTVITSGGSSGLYYASMTPTTSEVGLWHYRWSSTGTYVLTLWGEFRVIDPPRST